jgi:bromodomain-containing protein 8
LEKKRFQTVIHLLHQQISTHRSGAIFHAPIRAQDAPDYKDVILEPTDLKTIKGKVRDGTISNSKEYQREIYRMFANAMMYNPPHSEVYHLTEEVCAYISSYIYNI